MVQEPDESTPSRPAPPDAQGPQDVTLDAAARDRIGRGLRLHYVALLAQPIPERLRALVDDLAARSDRDDPR